MRVCKYSTSYTEDTPKRAAYRECVFHNNT